MQCRSRCMYCRCPAACTAGVPLQRGRWRQRLAAGTAGGATPGGPRGRRPVQRSLQQRQKRVAQPVLQLARTLGLQVEQDGKVAGVGVCRVVGWSWGRVGGREHVVREGWEVLGKILVVRCRAYGWQGSGADVSRMHRVGGSWGPCQAPLQVRSWACQKLGGPLSAPVAQRQAARRVACAAICFRSGQPVPQAPPNPPAPTALPAALPSRDPQSCCPQGQPCPPPLPQPHPTTPLTPRGTQPAAGRRSGSQSRGCAAPGERRSREGPRGGVRARRREASGRPQRDCVLRLLGAT